MFTTMSMHSYLKHIRTCCTLARNVGRCHLTQSRVKTIQSDDNSTMATRATKRCLSTSPIRESSVGQVNLGSQIKRVSIEGNIGNYLFSYYVTSSCCVVCDIINYGSDHSMPRFVDFSSQSSGKIHVCTSSTNSGSGLGSDP